MDRRSFVKRLGVGALGMATAGAAAAPAVWAKGPRVRWRMVTSWPPGMPILQTGAELFARRVDEMSGGRLTIQVFAGGELIPPLGVFDAVTQGTVECGHSASYYWGGKSPAAQWFTSVPFGLNAQGINAWFYAGDGMKLWEEVYAPFGLISRPGGNTGVQMGGWFNREIKTISDFKGLKMRIPGLGGKVLARAGGAVVLLSGGELYTSLERGVIDAAEWVGPFHDIRMGFHRVATFYYGPGWHEPGSALEVIMNRKAYEALPVDMQRIVDAAARESNTQILADFEAKNAEALQELLQDKRVELRRFPNVVLATLKRLAAETLEDEAAKDASARKVHASYKKFQASLATWSWISEKAYYEGMVDIIAVQNSTRERLLF